MKPLKEQELEIDDEEEILETLANLDERVEELSDKIDSIEIPEAIVGDKGDRGEKGLRGEIGFPGSTGPKGSKGEQGEKGEKGEQGEKGEDGKDGVDGESVKLKEVIEKLKPEVFSRFHGGGSANRQINVNSSVMSNIYTDINFIAGSVLSIATANDDTNKRVNITISNTAPAAPSAAISIIGETSYGLASIIGTSTNYARQDHTHGTVVTPTASTVGLANVGNFVTNANVYTPTITVETNLDATTTVTEAQYLRVGNTVTVSGRFTANPTLTATATSFELSLPVASNIGAVEDLSGIGFCGQIAGMGCAITGSVANDTAVITWVSSDTTAQSWSYTYSYQII